MRNDVTAGSGPECNEGGLRKLWKYHQQLVYISTKFPKDENSLRVPLIWTSAFPLEVRNVQGFGINYERCCVLWNLAALYGQMGVLHEDRTSVEGLKRAAAWFQLAAGVYKYLLDGLHPGELEKRTEESSATKEVKEGELKCTLPPDFGSESLLALLDLNLGQAQECFWAKAVTGMFSL
jgi:programmed cell death 6-interacting protein